MKGLVLLTNTRNTLACFDRILNADNMTLTFWKTFMCLFFYLPLLSQAKNCYLTAKHEHIFK